MTNEEGLSNPETGIRGVLSDVKTNIASQLGYVLFLILLLAFLVYYLYLTFGMAQEATWLLPRIAIIFGIVFVLIDLVKVAFFNRLSNALNWDESTEDKDASLVNKVKSTDQRAGILSILPIGLLKEVGWVVAYVGGLYYIGFFTGTFLFTSLYILTHQDKLTKLAVGKSIVLSSGIVGFLWVLFVHIMGTASVFRLGMFP